MILKRKWLWIGLEIVGGLTLALAVCLAALIGACFWGMSPYSEKTDSLKPRDAGRILAWGGVEKEAKVGRFLYSKISRRSFTGDHADFYVMQMDAFPAEAALKGGQWVEGPLTDATLKKAVDFCMMWGNEEYRDFPPREEMPERRFLFCFPWICLAGQRVYAAVVMAYDPGKKVLYVVDSKT